MANILTRVTGQASVAGTTIYTVGVDETITIVGLRASNNDNLDPHTFHVEINGRLITGIDTPLPIGSALEALSGSKVVAVEGDAIVAYSDENAVVDIYISYLSQTPEA